MKENQPGQRGKGVRQSVSSGNQHIHFVRNHHTSNCFGKRRKSRFKRNPYKVRCIGEQKEQASGGDANWVGGKKKGRPMNPHGGSKHGPERKIMQIESASE